MELRAADEEEIDISELHGHLGYLMRRAQLWIFSNFTQTLQQIPLTPAEFSVLVTIGANPGLAQTAIAEALGIERAGLVRLLDRLEAQGWTERRASRRDRRSHALHLTDEGIATLALAKALAQRHERTVAARFGTRRHGELLRLLKEASAGLRPDPLRAEPLEPQPF